MSHKAQFSPEILERFARLIPPGVHVHDPFAGPGVRLGKLCDEVGASFSGTELERVFIADDRVVCMNAALQLPESLSPFWAVLPNDRYIATSPAYPNGMAEDWDMQDGSRRMTYRKSKRDLGDDEPLHQDNQGRMGYRGTGYTKRSMKRWSYWRIAGMAAQNWRRWYAAHLLVNVSDFMHSKGKVEPVVDTWIGVLFGAGFIVTEVLDVKTQRNRDGANADQRVESEKIIIARGGS